MKLSTFLPVVAISAAGIFSSADAATVTTLCPGTAATTDREFSLTVEGTAAVCLASGAGNISGNPMNDPIYAHLAPGATLLDKTDGSGSVQLNVTGIGGLSGLWNIVVPTGYKLIDAVIAFKSGVAQLNPDWAAFELAEGTLSGSWGIENGKQSLSHANIYGTIVPAPVPLPAAGFLLAGALGAFGLMRRRKRA